MRNFVFCVLLVKLVSARPSSSQMTEAEFANLTWTVQKLNDVLDAYKSYEEFVPSYVYGPVENMTDVQKTAVVQMVNDYHAGKFQPKNYDELSVILHKSYPSVANESDAIHSTYLEHVAMLGPKGQAFCNDTEAKLYADANPDRIIWACHMFNNAQGVLAGVNALVNDDAESPKIEEAFPEAISFLHSKEFSAYRIVVNQLKPLDCTKDRQQIFNTIKLFDMKSVLTSKS